MVAWLEMTQWPLNWTGECLISCLMAPCIAAALVSGINTTNNHTLAVITAMSKNINSKVLCWKQVSLRLCFGKLDKVRLCLACAGLHTRGQWVSCKGWPQNTPSSVDTRGPGYLRHRPWVQNWTFWISLRVCVAGLVTWTRHCQYQIGPKEICWPK